MIKSHIPHLIRGLVFDGKEGILGRKLVAIERRRDMKNFHTKDVFSRSVIQVETYNYYRRSLGTLAAQ